MAIQPITEKTILIELRSLEPDKWLEVLDFIGYLKQRQSLEKVKTRPRKMTAADLLQSSLIGLWADRVDISDSSAFARQLRRQAGQRGGEHAAG
jgi:hypothetical protein